MGNILFGVDISGLLEQHVAPGLLEARVTRLVPGARPSPTSAPSTTPVTHDGRGIWEDIDPSVVDGTSVLLTDRVALLILDSFSPAVVPQLEDIVTIEGISLPVVKVLGRDPAAATCKLVCRDRGAVGG